MLQHANIALFPPDDAAIRAQLTAKIEKLLHRFPYLLDRRLYKGLERLIINSPKDFLTSRSFSHVSLVLLTQFFLQKSIENVFKEEHTQKPLFVRLFKQPSRTCVAFICHTEYGISKEQLLKALCSLLPALHELPRSSYLWHHPELPYFFCYVELRKLRGKELSAKQLRQTEESLREILFVIPPLTPTLFWPHNEEESYRNIRLLYSELRSQEDLPHLSIHFQEQTSSMLEFLVHIARPLKEDLLPDMLKQLPDALRVFCHSHRIHKTPFPIELGSFSLRVPTTAFDVRGSINLLYARRYVFKHLEALVGSFRDYNGGLFEKQQHYFEMLRLHLFEEIPNFDLFAEKLFYALHPVEKRLSLSLKEAGELFTTFSELLQSKESFAIKHCGEQAILIKTTQSSHLLRFSSLTTGSTKEIFHAQLTIGNFHYLCLLGPDAHHIKTVLDAFSFPKKAPLRLSFQEGAPLSLNPHYTFGDMRCRILSKLLFEGLTRLNKGGAPEAAGAQEIHCSNDGLRYTFILRPNAWSNGESVTAVDYAMSWRRALTDHLSHPEFLYIIKGARSFKEGRDPSELGIRVLNAHTLQIDLAWKDPHFLSKLSQPFFFPLFGSMREPKWFNGPYLVREYNKEKLILEKNPYFWNVKSSSFEQIEVSWQEDIEKVYSLLLEGNVDWIGDPLSSLSSHYISQLELSNILHKHPARRHFVLYFNTEHPLLKSSFIRRSLNLSIHRSHICQKIFPYSLPLGPLVSQKEEARALFKEGLRELSLTRQTLPPLTLSYSPQAGRERLALVLQAEWQETLGIRVNLQKKEWNLFRNNLEQGAFDICGVLQDIVKEGEREFFERFEGSSSWNFSRWNHSLYNQLLAVAKISTEKNHELLAQAKKILEEAVPCTPLFHYVHLYAHNPQLAGYSFDEEGCIDFSRAYTENIGKIDV